MVFGMPEENSWISCCKTKQVQFSTGLIPGKPTNRSLYYKKRFVKGTDLFARTDTQSAREWLACRILILCDFDGTVSIKDTVNRLVRNHVTSPEWRFPVKQYFRGEIGSKGGVPTSGAPHEYDAG